MSDLVHFIEVEPKEPCKHCKRKKLKETDKFYKVFIGDKDTGIVVCELCKGGFLTLGIEGPESTYATHLTFYVKNAFLKLKEKLPDIIAVELNSAIENYENGKYSASFRSIGFVAEWLTERLFVKKFGEELAKETSKWEDRLGRLLDQSRKNKKTPEEPWVFQLFSLKWLRNKVDHPSEYQVTGEDIRLGLVSIIYLLYQTNLHNLI
jgi:hypothetical protein